MESVRVVLTKIKPKIVFILMFRRPQIYSNSCHLIEVHHQPIGKLLFKQKNKTKQKKCNYNVDQENDYIHDRRSYPIFRYVDHDI